VKASVVQPCRPMLYMNQFLARANMADWLKIDCYNCLV